MPVVVDECREAAFSDVTLTCMLRGYARCAQHGESSGLPECSLYHVDRGADLLLITVEFLFVAQLQLNLF